MATQPDLSGAFIGFRWEEIENVLRDLNLTPEGVALLTEDLTQETELVLGNPEHKALFVRGIYSWIWMVCNEMHAGVFENVDPIRWESLTLEVRDFYVRASHACADSDLFEDENDGEYAAESGEYAAGKTGRAQARALARRRLSAERCLPTNWPRDLCPWNYGQRQQRQS